MLNIILAVSTEYRVYSKLSGLLDLRYSRSSKMHTDGIKRVIMPVVYKSHGLTGRGYAIQQKPLTGNVPTMVMFITEMPVEALLV
jgi:hypothetical protein